MERTLAQHACPSLSRHGPGFIRTPLIPALFRSAVPQSAAATLGTAAASASPKLRKAQLPSVCALKASSKASSVCVRRIVCANTCACTHAHAHTTWGAQNGERRKNRKARTHTRTHALSLTHTHSHTHTPRPCVAKQEAEEKKSGAKGMTKAKDENTAIFATPGGTPGATPPKVPKP